MLQGKGNAVNLQGTYDESYLTCSKAVFYESQGNEDEAMRCWKAALGVISNSRDIVRPGGQGSQSETESALTDSLRQLELQCKERIDLLEALRLSREDGPRIQKTNAPGIAEPKAADASSPGWIGNGTIPAISYTQLPRPPLPPRPSLQSRASSKHSTGMGSLVDLGSDVDSAEQSILRPVAGSSSQPTVSRSPSPDKHTLRTTLRTGKLGERFAKPKRRTGSRPASDGPGASRAAALAWSALGFRDRASKSQNTEQASTSLPAIRTPSREDRVVREPGSSRLQWDSHSRRLVASHERDIDPTPGSRHSLDSAVNSRRSRDHASPSASVLSVHAAASALVNNLPAEPTHSAPGRTGKNHIPRHRTAPPPEQPLKTPPPRAGDEKGASDGGTAERSSSTSDLPSRRTAVKEATTKMGGRHPVPGRHSTSETPAGASTSPGTGSVRDAMRRKGKTKDKGLERDLEYEALQTSGDSDGSESEKGGNAGGDRERRAILKNLPAGIDKDAAKQILNEIVVHGDEVHWGDVAGLEVAKAALREAVVYPFLRPDLFMGLREPARGMLLFGPPGTGKTMLARAVATESKSTFFSISASSLTSKYLGESEKLVRALFSLAKLLAPSIIFVDEIDSLLSQRSSSGEHEATRRLKTEFLIQWSDLQRAAAGRDLADKEQGDPNRVLVLAATNLPWAIDEAARRRFVRRQYIPLPESETRRTQLQALLGHQKHSLTEEDIEKLVSLTDGFSGSDITALAKDAAMGPLRSLGEALLHMTMDDIRAIGFGDFVASLRTIRPSVNKAGLKEYEDWAREFGERGG